MLSYCPKKGKNVMLLSTMHKDAALSTREDKITQMVLDYNETVAGVDNLDKVTATYSCRRMTACWPLVIFFHIIDGAHRQLASKNQEEIESDNGADNRMYVGQTCRVRVCMSRVQVIQTNHNTVSESVAGYCVKLLLPINGDELGWMDGCVRSLSAALLQRCSSQPARLTQTPPPTHRLVQ
ncbi:piggyBac transposable element-derived protein 4-like%2C partial [Scomber scombrus]|uniref:PiggyBac transposable element-derived protein 4-like, partial n=1 Tax=Scomber scombrus TaxID=13677 RepID=A0AAV1P103_SCOSC